ncbi:unnamed protein product [Urochloa decumbens]|uniref:FAS1 domain-containing protein n=1 Tax=Urochloa decumbens TaxID=240449 RepID=A0ABC8YGN1_9POAL
MAPFNHLRPLLLLLVPLLLIPLGPHHHAAAAAAHHHPSPGSTHAQHHRHSSPMITATAPSIITKDHESEESQPLLALEPFSAAAAVAATGGAEPMVVKGAAATAADPARRNPRRATTPPPRSFSAAADLASLSQPQPRAEAGRSAPEVGAPRVDEPATDLYSRAANAARLAASGTEERLLQLDRVLTSLGYNEMASAVALFARSASPTVARWRGPVTVFAAPDVLIQGSCPAACSRRHLLLGHLVLGYFPFAALVLAPAVELPSAAVGFCVHVASGGLGSLDAHRASLYVNGVEVSHPDLYNDGRYVVVHGLRGVVQRPLATASCIDGSRRRHWHICPRTAASSGPGPSVMRLMILEAIACLHVKGYSTVALVMSNSFAELQKLEKLTVFALDDGAIVNITSGDFGHIDYATVVLFHIIPGYRLTHADLLHLGHVTRLPTLLAGEDQNFGISYAEEAVTEPDMVTSSRLAIHGIGYPLSPAIRLTGTNDAIRWTTTDYGKYLHPFCYAWYIPN